MKKGRKWLSNPDAKFIRMLRFFIKFNLFAIPLYIILYEGWTLPALQRAIADFTVYALTALGINPTMNDLIVSIPVRNGDWGAVINWDCTGWKSLLAYFALVMATDYPMKRKLLGMLLLPVVFAVNLLRIIFMFLYVHWFDLENYKLVHTVVWSWGLILTILVLWLIWMRWDFTKALGQKHGKRRKNNI